MRRRGYSLSTYCVSVFGRRVSLAARRSAIAGAVAASLGVMAGITRSANGPLWLVLFLSAFGLAALVVCLRAAWEANPDPRDVAKKHREADVGSHFDPKGRGVRRARESGQYFTGRSAAIRDVFAWLGDDSRYGGLLTITGDPGSGKSAVLGRLVLCRNAGARHARSAPHPPGS
jgi:hypothetical protein